MKPDKKYIVIKPIPIDKKGDAIRVNTDIYRIHGNYYMDGGLLPEDYQEDFDQLISYEEKHGWKYIKPNDPVAGESII